MLHLLSPQGFQAGSVYAGIKTRRVPDVALLVCQTNASAAAMFTTNRVCAAPVKIGIQHIACGRLRGVVVNAGNANACTGLQGERDARRMCQIAAEVVGCNADQILPSSTGIIGHLLPMEKINRGIRSAAEKLGASAEHAQLFSDAILTTDLKRKTAAAQFKVGREKVTIAGVCKGSGMIGPRLAPPGALHATMLAYLTTDAKIIPGVLQRALNTAGQASFNSVTVDDHTSTNDTLAVLASGLGGKVSKAGDIKSFAKALNEVCQSLAYQIAADGEGATKVVRINVTGARNESDARLIARAIAVSPLVKCAMHGNDPNWGRIVSAAGFCGARFDPDRSQLKLQGVVVFKSGRPMKFSASQVSKMLKVAEVVIDLNCAMGQGAATVWTCDLSKEYVTINADYHT
ncbi:MAG: bifunctional glutamate N-acetyltransferase/amino-acid acetyltransferase ArgJ [Planctomycetota bacterium]|nr:bifunctional glutamate N-acetyltransferase/amino-acid acetyltransferase ArgJ [Planctomycetota bacterium]